MASFRLIATDMDGTLLREDQVISERTQAAIRDADAAGITVVAATGRGWRSATPLLVQTPEIATAICSNGALVRDIVGERDTDLFPIASDQIPELISSVTGAVPEAGLAWELASGAFGFDHTYAGMRPGLAEEWPDRIGERPPVEDGLLKLLVRHPDLDESDLLDILAPVVPKEVLATFSGISTVEVTGAGVHKAAALAVVCDRLGVAAAEVVAIGDNRNDVEMLRWAGRGVAMANAHPLAAGAADVIGAHHMDDGVARAIEDVLAGA